MEYTAFGKTYDIKYDGERYFFPNSETILKDAIDKYGEYVKVEFGPGRISERHKRPYVTIGLNESADPHCDIYLDLEFGIPFPDNSIDEIYSNQFLEHLKRENFIAFMNEQYRVLRHGGFMYHCVPHFLSPWAYADPTHKNYFSEKSFDYFCLKGGEPFVDSFSDYGIKTRFRMKQPLKVRERVDIKVWMEKI